MNEQVQPIGAIGTAPQAQSPVVPQQYSTEQTMQTNAGTETLSQVTVNLDNESLKIIKEASSLHAESIVNLGIKLFAKTNIYKEFMLKQDFKSLDNETEDISNLVDIGSVANTPQSIKSPVASTVATSATPSAGSFKSW